MKKIFALFMALTLLCAALTACGADAAIDLSKSYTKAHETVDYETNYVQIEIEGGAYIVVELYPDVAPVTVANFKKLVSEHFYDGIIFHRVPMTRIPPRRSSSLCTRPPRTWTATTPLSVKSSTALRRWMPLPPSRRMQTTSR